MPNSASAAWRPVASEQSARGALFLFLQFCIVMGPMDTSRYFWNSPSDTDENEAKDGQINLEPVRLGFVGLGLMGGASLERFLDLPASVVALCDVDQERLESAAQLVATRSGEAKSRRHADFRALCADPDVEAVVVSTPDHWHVDIAVAAMKHGKDVYVEKPLSLTIAGGRRLADTAEREGRIVQTGSQQRSSQEFRRAAELVRNNRLGRLREILVTLPPNNIDPPQLSSSPIPDGFNHEMWLGPAPWREYHRELCHYNFRFISDYSGGQMTNWGAHHLDIVQWALDMDSSGPVEIAGTGTFHPSGPFDTATSVDIRYRYANGVSVRCMTGTGQTGIEFRGEEGTVWVGRGKLESVPESLLHQEPDSAAVRLPTSDNHYLNFLQAVRTRDAPVAPAEIGHRSATVCHLGNIAVKLGRTLIWDPDREEFPGDAEANRFRSRTARSWEQE